MSSFFTLVLILVQFTYGAVLPITAYEQRQLLDLEKRETTPCGFYTTVSTKVVDGQTLLVTARLFNACKTVTSHEVLTVTSTSNHCDENEHCTSRSFKTPICEDNATDLASCTVLPSPVLTSNDSRFYVSPTTCYNPPDATGSFDCHATSTAIDVGVGVTSIFTYTNCDVPVFDCPTPFTPVTSATSIAITDCSSTTNYTCNVVGFTTDSEGTYYSTSCDGVTSESVVTTGTLTYTNILPEAPNTATCPTPFTPVTVTTPIEITDCFSIMTYSCDVIGFTTKGDVTYYHTSCDGVTNEAVITYGSVTYTNNVPEVPDTTTCPTTKTSSLPPRRPISTTSVATTTTSLNCNDVYWSTFTNTVTDGSSIRIITSSVFTHYDCEATSASTSTFPSLRPSSFPPVSTYTTSTVTQSVPCPSSFITISTKSTTSGSILAQVTSSLPSPPMFTTVTKSGITLTTETTTTSTISCDSCGGAVSSVPTTPTQSTPDVSNSTPIAPSSTTVEPVTSVSTTPTQSTPEVPNSTPIAPSSTTVEPVPSDLTPIEPTTPTEHEKPEQPELPEQPQQPQQPEQPEQPQPPQSQQPEQSITSTESLAPESSSSTLASTSFLSFEAAAARCTTSMHAILFVLAAFLI